MTAYSDDFLVHLPRNSQAFEAHWDYMESIIVQLSGSKTWNIAGTIVPLSRADLKFKPSLTQIEELQTKKNSSTPPVVVDLLAGDVLYIPSGLIHEAKTKEEAAAIKRDALTAPSVSTPPPPSIHLTIGVEIPDECTYASLVLNVIDVIGDMPSDSVEQQLLKLKGPALETTVQKNIETLERVSVDQFGDSGPCLVSSIPRLLDILRIIVGLSSSLHDSGAEELRRSLPINELLQADVFEQHTAYSTFSENDKNDPQPCGNDNPAVFYRTLALLKKKTDNLGLDARLQYISSRLGNASLSTAFHDKLMVLLVQNNEKKLKDIQVKNSVWSMIRNPLARIATTQTSGTEKSLLTRSEYIPLMRMLVRILGGHYTHDDHTKAPSLSRKFVQALKVAQQQRGTVCRQLTRDFTARQTRFVTGSISCSVDHGI